MVGRSIQANPFFLENGDYEFYGKDSRSIDKVFIVKKYFDYIKDNIETVSTYELTISSPRQRNAIPIRTFDLLTIIFIIINNF